MSLVRRLSYLFAWYNEGTMFRGCAREIVLGAALTHSDASRLGVCNPSCTIHKFISHPTNSITSHLPIMNYQTSSWVGHQDP